MNTENQLFTHKYIHTYVYTSAYTHPYTHTHTYTYRTPRVDLSVCVVTAMA